ncbi:MAG TPA: MlaD family protein [Desulfomonilaceae bacterium]|nr:MlaD family protein [Desulfomonilaceae bacterium]
MSSQADKFKIGLFVVGSLLLAVIAVVWLGASRYFEESNIVAAYFSESVQGLEVGSPVKFRGVPVGRVKMIRMAPDGKLIEVLMGLDSSFKITEDLGIKMDLVGLTGMKYLEMDTFRPEQQREAIHLDFTPKYKVIATHPSDIREIGTALESVFRKVKALDVERISDNLVKVTGRMDKILADSKLESLGVQASDTLREIRETSRRLHEEINRAQISKSLNKTMEKASEFFQESTETARSTDRLIRRTDNNLNRLTQKLDRSADNLIDFTRMIKLKPSSILFGTEEKSQKK